MRSQARSPAMVIGVIAVVAGLLSVLGISRAVRGQADAGPPVIEVSNSCAALGTTTPLTVWVASIPPGAHTISSKIGAFPDTSVGPVSQGNFSVTVPYSPPGTAVATDQVMIDGKAPGAPIQVVVGGQCPTSTAPALACLAPTAPVQLTVTGLSSFNADLPLTIARWNLDYPGSALALAAFSTSAVTNGSSAAALPANRAGPGAHTITVIASNSPDGTPLQFWTFPITFCPPTPATTTTARPTTTTTVPPTTTTTTSRPTTTTTRAPATTTTTFAPIVTPTTTTVGPAPVLSITPTVTSSGNVTQVSGAGFPPDSAVILEWQPGIGIVTVPVGSDGRFTTALLIMPRDQVGIRLVHARGFPEAVSAPVLVQPPPSAASQFIFRRP